MCIPDSGRNFPLILTKLGKNLYFVNSSDKFVRQNNPTTLTPLPGGLKF